MGATPGSRPDFWRKRRPAAHVSSIMSRLNVARAMSSRRTPAAVVDSGAPLARRQIVELLEQAGFSVWSEPQPGALVVVPDQPSELERLREIRAAAEARPDAPILAVVAGDPPNTSLRRALIAGAGGIVREAELDAALVVTARAMLAGQLAVPAALGRQIAPRPLSHREKQVLALVVKGLTNREIAGRLYLAESTVKTHLASAFRKLDARSRSEAVARIQDPETGYGVGILELDDEPLAAAG
jgi:DNA-binding NarL/FixJ family response regulator